MQDMLRDDVASFLDVFNAEEEVRAVKQELLCAKDANAELRNRIVALKRELNRTNGVLGRFTKVGGGAKPLGNPSSGPKSQPTRTSLGARRWAPRTSVRC